MVHKIKCWKLPSLLSKNTPECDLYLDQIICSAGCVCDNCHRYQCWFFSNVSDFTKSFHMLPCYNSVMTNNNTILQDLNSANWWRNSITKAGHDFIERTLRQPRVGRDWQRHYSILGTLPFRDYSDVTLMPLHGWMLKNYRATNNSTSRVHILQVLRYPLSLLQLTTTFFCT